MDELTTVCTCSNVLEAQAIRAALEARGLFVHLDGEHHSSLYGPFGMPVVLRVMVPRSELAVARELASDVAGELPPVDDEDEDEDEDGVEYLPHRRPQPSDLAPYGDDDDGIELYDDDDDDENEDDALVRRKGRHPMAKLMSLATGGVGLAFVVAGAIEMGMIVLMITALIWIVSARPAPESI